MADNTSVQGGNANNPPAGSSNAGAGQPGLFAGIASDLAPDAKAIGVEAVRKAVSSLGSGGGREEAMNAFYDSVGPGVRTRLSGLADKYYGDGEYMKSLVARLAGAQPSRLLSGLLGVGSGLSLLYALGSGGLRSRAAVSSALQAALALGLYDTNAMSGGIDSAYNRWIGRKATEHYLARHPEYRSSFDTAMATAGGYSNALGYGARGFDRVRKATSDAADSAKEKMRSFFGRFR